MLACERKEPPPEKTEPWRAPDATTAAASGRASEGTEEPARPTVAYRVLPTSTVRISLPAKEAKPSGAFRVVRGKLEVDLIDPSRTRGTVEVDLGSLRMGGEDRDEERRNTARALNWMKLGSSRPEIDVERLRTARFEIESISDLSHPAPHDARRLPPEKPRAEDADGSKGDRADEDERPTDGRAAQAPDAERRRLTLTAKGKLEMNGLRVERSVRLQVDFHYPTQATPGLRPSRIEIRTPTPFVVPLVEYEVQPRDAHGRLIAEDMELLGRVIGRTARVDVDLVAEP